MFERDKQQAVEQVTKRYAVFGVFAVVGIAAGLLLGGWPGFFVGAGILAAGSFASDIIHIDQIRSNFAQNVMNRPSVTGVYTSAPQHTRSNFAESEVARREAAAHAERTI